MPWREHLLVRDDTRIACRERGGPGQPVVLLHGLAGHGGEWDALAELLAPTHRVVTVDQRGHGASERHPHDVSRAAYIADVIAVIDHFALDRPVLVGQSMGGHTAMLTAAAHPGRIGALALVEAGCGGPNPGLPAHIGNWLDSWPTPFPSPEAAAAFFGGGSLGAGWAAGLEQRADGWWPRFDRDVLVRSLAENAQRSFHDAWTRVTCPTLLVLARSGFLPADEVTEMLRLRPETRAVSIPGTGHDVHLEAPEALYGALAGYLAEAVR
ncbi:MULTISPECIES: alpha/beta hydrolase [unclassified Streptomyces]|uniref:alpha/beta fold hydrolase n=1 Tax=unclassified Streptomyces TaxID=2593676 RepID=UPI00035C6B22|nr:MULTISPECIES: alpha/beta hydrolase [unclassified Streptomyces]MYY00762.1 alpha/beta fold hydrolase [Streptomyces sp. SID4913]